MIILLYGRLFFNSTSSETDGKLALIIRLNFSHLCILCTFLPPPLSLLLSLLILLLQCSFLVCLNDYSLLDSLAIRHLLLLDLDPRRLIRQYIQNSWRQYPEFCIILLSEQKLLWGLPPFTPILKRIYVKVLIVRHHFLNV